MSSNDDLEPETPFTEESTSSTKPKRKKFGGKKKGWKKDGALLSNGKFSEANIFKFVPKASLPESEVPRFIDLCDSMIKDLGADTVSDSDLEEIALYYRDRIYCDMMYKNFAEAGGVTDSTMVLQIDKFNKALEQRKTNLGSRFIDKGKKRKDGNSGTLMDLIGKFSEDQKSFQDIAMTKKLEIQANKDTYTNTLSYMEDHIGSNLNLTKEEE